MRGVTDRRAGRTAPLVAAMLLLGAVIALFGAIGAGAVDDAGATAPGAPVWMRDVDSMETRPDKAVDVAVAPDGSVYALAGVKLQTGAKPDVVLLTKYSAGGTRRWIKTYGVQGRAVTHPHALAVDGRGNVFVAGRHENDPAKSNGLLVKYSPSGKRLWVKTYAGPGLGDDEFADVGCDAAGNVYVCGVASVNATTSAAILRKYSPKGALRWTRLTKGFGSGTRAAALVVKASTGAVWVTGPYRYAQVGKAEKFPFNIRTARYTTGGVKKWSQVWSSEGIVQDHGRAIALDPRGEVYVAGSVMDTPIGHAVVLNYGTGGGLHWAADDAAREPLPMSTRISGIGVDKYGRARLAGTYFDEGYDPAHVAIVRKYEAGGGVAWETQIKLGDYSTAEALTVVSGGAMYTAGYARHFIFWEEMPYTTWVVKHDAAGVRSWTFEAADVTPGAHAARVTALRGGRLYVIGDRTENNGRAFLQRLVP